VTHGYDEGLANLIKHIIQSDQARNPADTDLLDTHAPTIEIGPVQTARSSNITLLRSALPFIKIGRVFLNKLLVTPISRPPFTIKSLMSSFELINFMNQTYFFSHEMWIFTKRLVNLSDSNRFRTSVCLKKQFEKTMDYFDVSIELLNCHLVPLHTDQMPFPRSKTLFNDHFSFLIDQVRLAAQNFSIALERFRNE
jgi:hypothetical protein